MKILAKFLIELARSLFKSKQDLILENLILRQQLTIYKRRDKKPKIENIDRMILVWMSKLFSNWKSALVVVKASTLIGLSCMNISLNTTMSAERTCRLTRIRRNTGQSKKTARLLASRFLEDCITSTVGLLELKI